MAAANTDKLRKGYYGNPTTLSSGIGNTDTTLPFSSTTGWPTGTAIDVVIDRVDANGTRTPSKQETVTVVISGSNGTAAIRGVEGTAQSHSAGAVVEVLFTASTHNSTVDWALTQHNQDGSHSAITATSITTTGAITENGVAIASVRAETFFDHVASGCVITGTGYGASLAWSMTAGVVYIGGRRLTVSAASGSVTASKDTYFDLLDPGSGTVATLVTTGGNIVANNAASPALAASSVRIGIIVSGANIAAATSVNQGGTTVPIVPIVSNRTLLQNDSLGNPICPRTASIPSGPLTSYVATSESTASGSFIDLTTVGPVCTIKVGRSGMAIVTIEAEMANGTVGATSQISVAVSGSTTIAAAATANLPFIQVLHAASAHPYSASTCVITGLVPGINTFTMRYVSGGGSTTFFLNRRMTVIPV